MSLRPLSLGGAARAAVDLRAADGTGDGCRARARCVDELPVAEDVLGEQRHELLGNEALRPPEAEQPERHGGGHDGKRHGVHRNAEADVRRCGDGHGRDEPSCGAGERAGGELSHHLLGVLADVLVH